MEDVTIVRISTGIGSDVQGLIRRITHTPPCKISSSMCSTSFVLMLRKEKSYVCALQRIVCTTVVLQPARTYAGVSCAFLCRSSTLTCSTPKKQDLHAVRFFFKCMWYEINSTSRSFPPTPNFRMSHSVRFNFSKYILFTIHLNIYLCLHT
jgi:hypothetical protein